MQSVRDGITLGRVVRTMSLPKSVRRLGEPQRSTALRVLLAVPREGARPCCSVRRATTIG